MENIVCGNLSMLCRQGELDKIIEFYNANKNNNIINITIDAEFDYSCKNGRLVIAQCLWKLSDGIIDKEYAFKSSCENGHLDVAKWLWKISDGTINMHIFDEYVFKSSCENGHLDVVQWLWKISKGTINMHVDDEYVFRSSCRYGYLDVAQWLWMISEGTIDIHTDNEHAFRWCCKNGHRDVAKWLCDLYLDERYILKWYNVHRKLYIKICSRNKRIIDKINNPYGKSDVIERVRWMVKTYGLNSLIKMNSI